MKKVFAIILTALLLLSVTACNNNNETPNGGYIDVGGSSDPDNSSSSKDKQDTSDNNSTSSTPDDASKPDDTSTPEAPSTPDDASKPEGSSKPDDTSIPDVTSKPDDTSTPETPSTPEDNPTDTSQPEEVSKPETPSEEKKLPLKDYPNGSYFTKDGKECADHIRCSSLIDCNCINFDGGIQAFAFARYVYFTVTGNHLGDVDKTEADADVTAESAKSMLKDLPEGAYIGVQAKEGSPHAMILLSATESDITVYQGNYAGNCLVSVRTFTWEQFARSFPHINNYASSAL